MVSWGRLKHEWALGLLLIASAILLLTLSCTSTTIAPAASDANQSLPTAPMKGCQPTTQGMVFCGDQR